MQTTLELADRVFENAALFRARCDTLPKCEAVDALASETGRWFGALKDDEGEAGMLRQRLWRMRAAAQLTLLPFDHPDLSLPSECTALVALARFIPALAERRERLTDLVRALTISTENPKRREVFKRLDEYRENNGSAGIVAALTRGRVPGWPTALIAELQARYPKIELLTSRASVDHRVFDCIFVPSGGRLCPVLRDVYYCGCTKTLQLIAYRSEAVSMLERPGLPSGTLRMQSTPTEVEHRVPLADEESSIAEDAWMQKRFWTSARADIASSFASGSQFRVPARLVILANTWKTLLEDDSKILEVSEILSAREAAQKLPRRKVGDLRPGHLIVLRTSGSGGYLISVADALLRSAGRQQLRAEATRWKKYLRDALVNHGTAKIAKLLAQKGHLIANHRYMEVWTTDRVISPEKDELFRDLILILSELKCLPSGSDANSVANTSWMQMRELVHFHHLAGNKIRSALLQELRRIIDAGKRIEGEMGITLQGVDAGQLSLFRVSDVDSDVIDVPYTELEVLRRL